MVFKFSVRSVYKLQILKFDANRIAKLKKEVISRPLYTAHLFFSSLIISIIVSWEWLWAGRRGSSWCVASLIYVYLIFLLMKIEMFLFRMSTSMAIYICYWQLLINSNHVFCCCCFPQVLNGKIPCAILHFFIHDVFFFLVKDD